VPYRHYLLASLRAGLSAIAMMIIAAIITACSNSQADAPPPPPEVDAAEVATKSVRQWDEFTGRIAAIDAVDIRPRVSGYMDRIAFKEGDIGGALRASAPGGNRHRRRCQYEYRGTPGESASAC
jgi:membrane fusion protein, multidrug efflux system